MNLLLFTCMESWVSIGANEQNQESLQDKLQKYSSCLLVHDRMHQRRRPREILLSTQCNFTYSSFFKSTFQESLDMGIYVYISK